MTPLDAAALRLRFPALARTGEDGRPVVYADAPGGSQVPETVVDAIAGHLRSGISNTHGAFAASEETDALIADARRRGVRHHRRRSGRDRLRAELDDVAPAPLTVVRPHAPRRATRSSSRRSTTTRTSVRGCWRPQDAGATVRWVDIRDDDATLDLDSFDAALNDRTRLVAFTLASNAVGTIPPAAELVRRVHAVGALAAVDGVHFAQHRALDLHALDADILACSPYKFFGPHLGVLSVRRELLDDVDAVQAASGAGRSARPLGDRHAEPRGTRGTDRRGRLPGRRRPDVRRSRRAGPT